MNDQTTKNIEKEVRQWFKDLPEYPRPQLTTWTLNPNEIYELVKAQRTEAYQAGVRDERERIAKLLNVQEDKDGNLFIELDDILKEVLGL